MDEPLGSDQSHRRMEIVPNSLDGEAWMSLLEKVALALGKDGPPVRLCLIGSAACPFGGMEGRTSRDHRNDATRGPRTGA